jgi:parvulin-like peptidyl-prolyl isomerase
MGGMVMLERRTLGPDLDRAVSNLQPEEVSTVTQSGNNYYVIQFIDRSEAQDEGLEKIRPDIERTLKRIKVKQLGDDYITGLHKNYPPDINHELLSSMNFPMSKEEREKWLGDRRVLIRVGNADLTAGGFVRGYNSKLQNLEARDTRIKQWIDARLVDNEALSRHYEQNAEFQNRVDRYANQLIKKEFIERYIKPEVMASRSELQNYYDEHTADFQKPAQHRIQQITVRTIDEGGEILNSLHQGADFSWLAKKRSIDRFGPKGGDLG